MTTAAATTKRLLPPRVVWVDGEPCCVQRFNVRLIVDNGILVSDHYLIQGCEDDLRAAVAAAGLTVFRDEDGEWIKFTSGPWKPEVEFFDGVGRTVIEGRIYAY